jgi:inosine/uridine-preferring nucleoside hydrolase
MTNEQFFKNLESPQKNVDMVLDTDAFNEVDDQYAIVYMLRSTELNPVAIYAAPFLNGKSESPADGMEKSYNEIMNILELAGRPDMKDKVYHGSSEYLKDESTPAISTAAEDLCKRAMCYTPENPLYVVAIGAITNVASALLLKPEIKENIVVVWLGGNAVGMKNFYEFNMSQDIAAARVVIGSGVPFVQLPCYGVVSGFTISKPELEYWLLGKNPIADYLARATVKEAESYAAGEPWTRVIWDVTAVAWLINKNDHTAFMWYDTRERLIPGYDGKYHKCENNVPMCYVNVIHRDSLMKDLIKKLLQR